MPVYDVPGAGLELKLVSGVSPAAEKPGHQGFDRALNETRLHSLASWDAEYIPASGTGGDLRSRSGGWREKMRRLPGHPSAPAGSADRTVDTVTAGSRFPEVASPHNQPLASRALAATVKGTGSRASFG